MPARPRLASEAFDAALEVQMRYPHDEGVKDLVVLIGNLHYGSELALAYLNRGIDGNNARRLEREYARFKQRIEAVAQ